MDGLKVGDAATQTGWSARMLRYLERSGLVVPLRSTGGYRLYGRHELNQLRGLDNLRARFQVELDEIAFAMRLRGDSDLRAAVENWLAGTGAPDLAGPDLAGPDLAGPDLAGPDLAGPDLAGPDLAGMVPAAWVEWEQGKHERLLAA